MRIWQIGQSETLSRRSHVTALGPFCEGKQTYKRHRRDVFDFHTRGWAHFFWLVVDKQIDNVIRSSRDTEQTSHRKLCMTISVPEHHKRSANTSVFEMVRKTEKKYFFKPFALHSQRFVVVYYFYLYLFWTETQVMQRRSLRSACVICKRKNRSWNYIKFKSHL